MKYTVKLMLYTYQSNDKGQYPIYIRITIDRKQVYIATGYYLKEQYWDQKNELVKNHTEANIINADIISRKQTIVRKIVDCQVKGESITATQLKASVTKGYDHHNLFQFAEAFVQEVQYKRSDGTLKNYTKHLKVVELFHGSRSLSFEEIDHAWLVRFEEHLRQSVGGNYIYVIWKTLKTFFNAAIKRKIITHYPFDTYENPEYTAPQKDYLTLKELDQLEKLADKTTNSTLKQTVVYFLLGCYSGLRLSDWQQFDYNQHYKDGRLFLRAKKNGEWVTMPVVGRLKRHLERVKMVPLKITEQEMNRTLKNIAGIKKKISTHTGRKTFAVTMCSEMGISLEVCATIMGITMDVCMKNYYSVTPKKIEDELKSKWK